MSPQGGQGGLELRSHVWSPCPCGKGREGRPGPLPGIFGRASLGAFSEVEILELPVPPYYSANILQSWTLIHTSALCVTACFQLFLR